MREREGSTHLANEFDEGRTVTAFQGKDRGHFKVLWTFGQRGFLQLAQGFSTSALWTWGADNSWLGGGLSCAYPQGQNCPLLEKHCPRGGYTVRARYVQEVLVKVGNHLACQIGHFTWGSVEWLMVSPSHLIFNTKWLHWVKWGRVFRNDWVAFWLCMRKSFVPCCSCPKEEWLALDVVSASLLSCASKGCTGPRRDVAD